MRMKKLITGALASAAFAVSATASAELLLNWRFNPAGGGFATAVTINEFLDIVGPSYVQTTVPDGSGNFTFTEWGAFITQGHDGGTPYTGFSNVELTATLVNNTGTGTLGGSIAFNPGGVIELYSESPIVNQFATTAGVYGATDGVNFGDFSVVSGGGAIDPTGIPNGVQTIIAQATALTCGYWFNSTGTDLCTLVGGSDPLLFGFVTVNASRVVNPSSEVVGEIVNTLAGDATFTNCLPGQTTGGCTGAGEFVISNNGQFRLSVPEPASLALVGLALAIFGFSSFRRRQA